VSLGLSEPFRELYSSRDFVDSIEADWLPWLVDGLDLGDEVVDLVAGPGPTVQLLRAAGRQVTAAQAVPALTAQLAEQFAGDPGVDVVDADPRKLPFPDGRFSAATAVLWLHHVPSADEQDQALAEVLRVLRPGGVLAGLWNADDYSVDWVRGYHDAAAEERDVLAVPAGGDRPDLLADHPDFAPCARAEFGHSRRLTVDGLIDVLGTHSWALVSTPERREEVFRRIRGYLATRRGLVGPDGSFELPLRTAVVRTLRR
jgi:SAM-dependent methyltransferase